MAGNVYLRTNRFEVKLEGITFKRKDFEYLCSVDFLFPEGRVWGRPPIVGLDVMPHPRDPHVLLLLLSFGVGCVILRFAAGEPLPPPIRRFLSDRRIQFVGFGIPEKAVLFLFDELGLTDSRVDIGYLAAKALNRPECQTWELSELALRVLGIKRMVGLTEASEDERHERIKAAICQLFIATVIAMGLLRVNGGDDRNKKTKKKKKKTSGFQGIKTSFLKKLDGGWFRLPKGRKRNKKKEERPWVTEDEPGDESVRVHLDEIQIEDVFGDEFLVKGSPFANSFIDAKEGREDDSFPHEDDLRDDAKDADGNKPLKGILKCPSVHLLPDEPVSSSTVKDSNATSSLRRANSKGCNVRFKCQ